MRSRFWRTETGHVLPFIQDPRAHKARILGAHLAADRSFGNLPKFSAVRASLPRIDRGDWQEVDYSSFQSPVLDQGETGSCVGHGTVTSFVRAWDMAGNTFRRFSACYLYSLINGGRDGGAVGSDALTVLQSRGVCLESTVPEGRIFRNQYNTGSADSEATRFRCDQAYHCQSFDDLGAALMLGYTVCFGILVGQAFMDGVDAGGVAGLGIEAGGHWLSGYGLRNVPAGRYKGQWAIRTQNSWNLTWGLQGTCLLVEDHFNESTRDYPLDAFAFKSVVDDIQDPVTIPPRPLA